MKMIINMNYDNIKTIIHCLNKELDYIDSRIAYYKKIFDNKENGQEQLETAYSAINAFKIKKELIINTRNIFIK